MLTIWRLDLINLRDEQQTFKIDNKQKYLLNQIIYK